METRPVTDTDRLDAVRTALALDRGFESRLLWLRAFLGDAYEAGVRIDPPGWINTSDDPQALDEAFAHAQAVLEGLEAAFADEITEQARKDAEPDEFAPVPEEELP